MKLKHWLLITLFIGTGAPLFAQSDSTALNRTARALTDYYAARPVEKVYLHLDKTYYISGDTIWFKAYTVVGNQHQLSALSGVAYCELINGKDSVVNRHVVKLIAGLGWGNFALPRSVSPGNYHIRAYTNWMRNAGSDYFYDQKIKIGGAQQLSPPANQTVQQNPDVQFFPEGGQLVNGVRSKVAVKCVSANGLGLDIKGVVTDNDGNEVADFATQHLGMGIFALIPQPGKTYKASIIAADSSHFTVNLPAAQEQGFILAVNSNNPDSIYIKIAANDKLFQAKQNTLFYVLAQSGGKVYYTALSKLTAPVFTAPIAKSRFPSGIVQFTLFSQEGEPLNERVIFIQSDDTIKLKLSVPSQTYSTRQNVKINLSTNGSGAPVVQGSYSVSVINESRVPVNENEENTILTGLLLSSDIKGYIEQPNYYFNNINDQTRADLDILMLTQGYRRFDWKQVLNNTAPPLAYQPEKSLYLAGSIKTPGGKPVPNASIKLLATKQSYFTDTTTNVNGDFKFENIELPDTARIVLRARKANDGTNVAIYIKNQRYPDVIKTTINTDTTKGLTAVMLQNIADYHARLKQDSLKNGKVLKEVVVKDKATAPPDRFNNYGTSLEYDADMKKLNREFSTLGDALPSIIPGANYVDGKGISYEFQHARLIIDGLGHTASDINLYDPREIDNVRMVSATGTRPALLIVTTKRYAGTDTASTQLKEVVIKDKRVKKEPDLSESQNLHAGAADQVIMGDKVSGCIKLSDCLQGKVFGVSFASDGTPTNNRQIGTGGGAPMSVIIDGNILDGSHLNDLNADDIYSIEVLRSGAARSIYGSSISGGGALVITTKHGGESSAVTSVDPSGLITYPFKGYNIARVFYSPKYNSPKNSNSPDDLRSTIYWNPNIITDKDGKASFEYYNADTKGTYRIVVEGINDNGNIGRVVYKYKVE